MKSILSELDIVHTQMPCIYPTRVASSLALRAGKPLFYSQRGMFDPQQLQYRRFKKMSYINLIEKRIMHRATGLIALTEAEVENFRLLGIETPCHIVPTGIDVQKFRRHPSEALFNDFRIDPASQLVLYLGRMHPTKGPDLLVEAFIKAARRLPRTVLILAGPDEHGMIPNLQRRMAQNGLAERFVFTGMVDGERKLDLLARADLMALPSVSEGLSNTALEALASGTPLVVSQGCNMPIIETMKAGLVVPRTSEAFAEGMVTLLADAIRLKATGENAYRLACERFAWGPILETLENVYRATLPERHR
jgi:glycosyltransferase involved in cell wall biosynthesis